MIKLLHYEPLLLIPVVYTILFMIMARSRRFLGKAITSMEGRVNRFANYLLTACKFLIPLLLILVLAKPVFVSYRVVPITLSSEVIEHNAKLPVAHVILIDVSKSMSYQEGGVTRLELAKEFVADYLKYLGPRDRVVVAVFCGNVTTYCRGYARECLLNITGVSCCCRYTAIGDAIAYAIGNYRATDMPNVIVVVSDGANNYGGDPVDAALVANESRLPVVFIRVGVDPRANELIARLKDANVKVFSVNQFSFDMIDDIAKEAFREAKFSALKASGKAFIIVEDYDFTPIDILLVATIALLIVIGLEGV